MKKNIDLVCIDCVDVDRAIDAINICTNQFDFDNVIFLTDKETTFEHKKIKSINSLVEYNRFVLTDLPEYIKSDNIMICQYDGFILNPNAWDDEFLKYDFIGAPWKLRNWVLGNGGFCLRTKKLVETVANIMINGGPMKTDYPEDFIICGFLREMLEKKYNINFAPIDLAFKFSAEDVEKWSGEFGFHNFKKIDLKRDGWVPPSNIEYKTERFINYFKD